MATTTQPRASIDRSVGLLNFYFWESKLVRVFVKIEDTQRNFWDMLYLLVAVTLSGILKAKQKLGVTFNYDKQDVIDFTKISKMTMCRA